MSTRTSAWLAWSLAALSVAMLVASVALYVLAHFAEQALVSSDVLDDLLVFVPFLAFPSLEP